MANFHGGRHLLAHIMMARTSTLKKYDFYVVHSTEDNEWVGKVTQFPSLSYVAPSLSEAMRGIRNFVCEEDYFLRLSFMGH